MNIEEIRDHCLLKPHVEECFPFDESTLVFKAGGKMFLLMDINGNPVEFNAKCEPAKAIELREQFRCIKPGFHMNKSHWNTVTCDGSAPKKLILEWIDNSYELIIAGLPKKVRDKLK